MLEKNVSKITIAIGLIFMLIVLQVIQPAASKAPPDLPNNSCANCHLKLDNSTTSTYAMWSVSTHALFEVTCEKCHGGDPSQVLKLEAHKGISNSSIERPNIPGMCGKCHTAEFEQFKNSQHFKRLESNQEGPAPSCITCHQAHSVRVLTASEIEGFCSNCHNYNTGINPTVPKRAESALSSVKELQLEVATARSSILEAKAMGKDVTVAEANFESANTILKNTPSVWHRFNLTYFDTEVQKGLIDAKNAEKAISAETETTATVPTKVPGFEVYLMVLGMLAVYLLRRH